MTLEEKKTRFISRLANDFPDKYEQTLTHLSQRDYIPLLINTLKTDKKMILGTTLPFTDGPFENTLVIDRSYKDKLWQLIDDGYLYIQNFASHIPINLINPSPYENILDMCSAPGGKSLLISIRTNNNANIVAVENNKNRVYKMQSVFDLYGVKNITALYADASSLVKRMPQYALFFDKILLDVPCSNEGVLDMNKLESFTYWHPKHPEKLSKLQRRLLHSAYTLLKPGGKLVYSTCTLSYTENEDNARWFEEKYKDMSFVSEQRIIPNKTFTAFYAVCYTKSS